ncbi:MAG: NUDIX domain-containing protein [Lewinellaceae bacterium]|nr:NUDIX domain-containing protein [Lewinella sp.]MCB9280541.1 NUDIX domain-containing protein [Lewinellaceae bacterium]
MSIRSAAKAIIIHEGRLLVNVYENEKGIHYALPGGGQDKEETLREAVVRECREEINCAVEAGEMLFVREYINTRLKNCEGIEAFHQIDHFFRCRLLPGHQPAMGPGADQNQIGIDWLPLERLQEARFFPAALIPWLADLDAVERPVYLGAVD